MKKQVSFRIDEELIESLDHITKQYPRLSLTDIVDLALKHFLQSSGHGFESRGHLDKMVGMYLRGEFDSLAHNWHTTYVHPEKKRAEKKQK